MADDDWDIDLEGPASHEVIDDLVDKAMRGVSPDDDVPDDVRDEQQRAIDETERRIRSTLMDWFQWDGTQPSVNAVSDEIEDELDDLHEILERIANES